MEKSNENKNEKLHSPKLKELDKGQILLEHIRSDEALRGKLQQVAGTANISTGTVGEG